MKENKISTMLPVLFGIIWVVIFIGCKDTKISDQETDNDIKEETAREIEAPLKNDLYEKRHTNLKSDQSNPYYLIQKDTSKIHQYGNVRLKKDKDGWYVARNINKFTYYEMYPNIVNKETWQRSKPLEVLYYSEDRKTVIKKVDLKKLNPYLKIYDNIKQAYPTFERYEAPPENEKHLYVDVKPDQYLTFYHGGQSSLNGYTAITYSLVPLKNEKILSWESTTVILDRQGGILTKYKEDNHISPTMLSDNGKLFAYRYGRYPDNPHDQAHHGEFKIVDLQSGKVIYHVIPKEGYRVGASANSTLKGFISVGHGKIRKPRLKKTLDFINLDTRERYYREFTMEEIKKAWDQYGSYLNLIDHYAFTKTTF